MSVEAHTPDPLSPPPEATTETAPETAPEPAAAPRRRAARTAGLIAVAAVLGLVGGTAVGYGIQAEREPTPLPALNQLDLVYPSKPLAKGQEPKPLSAAEDRSAKAQGDLRKLLLPKPAGAKETDYGSEDGWMDVSEYVDRFDDPGLAFGYQLEQGIRRVATTSWRTGEHRTTEIRLVQYRPTSVLGARDRVEDQQDYEDENSDGGFELKGSTNGRAYVHEVDRKAGYMDVYTASAFLHRGDIAVEIFMADTKKISRKDISSVAERQLGRL